MDEVINSDIEENAVKPEADSRKVIDGRKSARDLIWNTIFSILTLTLGFITNLIIGRKFGKSLLGVSGQIDLITNIGLAFFMIGGTNVIVNFLPRCKKDKKLPFLITYSLISLSGILLYLIIAFVKPDLLRLVINKDISIDTPLKIYLALLMIAVIIQTIFVTTLQAEIKLRYSAYPRIIYSIFLVALVVVGIVFFKFKGDYRTYMFIAMAALIAYIASCIVGFILFVGNMRNNWTLNFGLYLPRGFWEFTIPLHIGTIIFFFYSSIDRVLISNSFGIESFGIYKSAISVVTPIIVIPSLIMPGIYAIMCNLVVEKNDRKILKLYRMSNATMILISCIIGISVIEWISPILKLFGKAFSPVAITVGVIMILTNMIVSGSMYVDGIILTAYEKIKQTLVINIIGAISSTLLCLLALRWGLIGIALGFTGGKLILALCIRIATRVQYKYTMPTRYYIFIFMSAFLGFAVSYLKIKGILITGILWMGSMIVLALAVYFFKLFTREEYEFIQEVILKRIR